MIVLHAKSKGNVMPSVTKGVVVESFVAKYRPAKFSGVIGQDSAVSVLKAMISSKRIHPAILISGNTGVGKTTIARLIAKYVNCETNTACGKCAACTTNGTLSDVVEVNSSDSRGIDDVRDLILSSQFLPRLPYRVIILDECHQLTPQAQQALLKALEDPSARTIWILVTTAPEKLLRTILGRCLRINLLPLSEKDIVARLVKIISNEYGEIDDKIHKLLVAIAASSCGQMRDAVQESEKLTLLLESGNEAAIDKYSQDLTSIDEYFLAIVAAVKSKNMKSIIYHARTCPDVRQLLSKAKFVLGWTLDNFCGNAKFGLSIGKNVVNSLGRPFPADFVIGLLTAFVKLELLLNTSPIDPKLLLLSSLCDFVSEK